MGRTDRVRRLLSVAMSGLLALLVLTGCSGSPSSTTHGSSASSGSSGDATTVRHYTALGDSYSAAPLVPVTDVAGGCFRSSGNYPTLVARSLHAALHDRTCSGAAVDDFVTSQLNGIAPQFTGLRADTDLVTIGIGGNQDRVFATLTDRCPAVRAQDPDGAPCQRLMRQGGTDRLTAAIKRSEPALATAVREVHRRSPRAEVLLVGYPQIADAQHRCAQLPLAAGDYAYVARVNQALNDNLRQVATSTGATYVDVFAATRGHDICSSDPWINGSTTDQRRALRFHPFAAEQQAVARLIEETLSK